MTGYVVRVKRGGKLVHVDFDELTDEEFERVEVPADDGWVWAVALAYFIRDNLRPVPIDPPRLRLHRADRGGSGAGD
jgi:hypothetical protein